VIIQEGKLGVIMKIVASCLFQVFLCTLFGCFFYLPGSKKKDYILKCNFIFRIDQGKNWVQEAIANHEMGQSNQLELKLDWIQPKWMKQK